MHLVNLPPVSDVYLHPYCHALYPNVKTIRSLERGDHCYNRPGLVEHFDEPVSILFISSYQCVPYIDQWWWQGGVWRVLVMVVIMKCVSDNHYSVTCSQTITLVMSISELRNALIYRIGIASANMHRPLG